MRILLVKTSSLGDIIHTFPALSDVFQSHKNVNVDWLVEENFADILDIYRHQIQPVPLALRRWRKHLGTIDTWKEIRSLRKALKAKPYDYIIDAQGLLKSACLTLGIDGCKIGMDYNSCREPFAAYTYDKTFAIAKPQHAVLRLRELMAKALDYKLPQERPDYGIKMPAEIPLHKKHKPYVLLVHGTSASAKLWPLTYWKKLAKRIVNQGYQVKLPWGNQAEFHNALEIAKSDTRTADIEVLQAMKLSALTKVISQASALVAVDTGLGHLAAAMNKPCISLYLVTSPLLTGAYGQHQIHLAVRGHENRYIKKQLSSGEIKTPVRPVYLDKVPDDLMVYDYLKQILTQASLRACLRSR